MKRTSLLSRLNPVFSEDGLMRIGGIAGKAPCLTDKEKHPVILPKNAHLSELLITYYHETSCHVGQAHTLTLIRQNGLWVVSGMKVAKNVIA